MSMKYLFYFVFNSFFHKTFEGACYAKLHTCARIIIIHTCTQVLPNKYVFILAFINTSRGKLPNNGNVKGKKNIEKPLATHKITKNPFSSSF